MKKIITILAIVIGLLKPASAYADTNIAGGSARLKSNEIASEEDFRVQKLEYYLISHNSPLSEHAGDFVRIADQHNLDWRLVPAISGVESTFGKRIPYKSYNAYGWAGGNYYFSSWDESIEVVSSTLRSRYIDRGATSVDKIARIYAPPSNTWAHKVKFFMNQIDSFPVEFTL